MCLRTVTQKDLNKNGIGYKIIPMPSDEDKFVGYYHSVPLGQDKWLTSNFKKFGELHSCGDQLVPKNAVPYNCGFHIFLKACDAKKYRTTPDLLLVEVEYKEGHTQGTHHVEIGNRSVGCIVAHKMKYGKIIAKAVRNNESQNENPYIWEEYKEKQFFLKPEKKNDKSKNKKNA